MEISPIIKQDYLTFEDSDTLSSMAGKMKMHEKRAGLVFRKEKYVGLVEKKKLLRSKLDLSKAKISNFVKSTPILSEHADIIESAYLMFQSNMNMLPVEKDKQIVGVVDGLALVKLATILPELKGLKVSDIKIVKSEKINRNDPVSTAIEIMYQKRIDHVPIFDKGKLYGIVTYKDLMRRYMNWSQKKDVSAKFNAELGSKGAEPNMPKLAMLPVENFSTNDNLLTISEDTKLIEAIKKMAKGDVSNLIVTEGGDYKGLLTVKNILRKIGSLKIPQNFNIKFIGVNDCNLKPHQKFNLKKIASNEAFKLQRQLRNEVFDLVLHLKSYSREGNRHKYSVTMRIEFPSQLITATQEDWDFETALRKTFNNAKNKLKKKFKTDSAWMKYYG